MKYRYLSFILLLSLAIPLSLSADDHRLLEQADSLVSYPDRDFSAQYTIVQDKPGQGRSKTVAGVFRRDSQESYVIVLTEPAADKGQGYLKQGQTLWFFDPESRRFSSTSAAHRFQNSNARNSDFTSSSLAQDYRVASGRDVTLGRFDCRLLELEAVSEGVAYPRMKIWISSDGLVRKSEDYSLSGQLLRTTAIPSYRMVDGKAIPRQILFIDALRGAEIDGSFRHEKTQITISKPSFEPLPDSVFSKRFLEDIAR